MKYKKTDYQHNTKSIFYYDYKHLLVRKDFVDEKEMTTIVFRYEFDKHGNWIKMIDANTGKNLIVRNITYYDDGTDISINPADSINYIVKIYDNKDKIDTVSYKKSNTNFETSLFRLKPFATIVGALLGGFDLEFAIVPYVNPKIGIPIEFQLSRFDGVTGIAILSGIEAVPITHREKSGLYFNAQIGGIYLVAGYENLMRMVAFGATAHIGYQLLTKNGFLFTPAVGFWYDSLSGIAPHIMLDIGFELKNKHKYKGSK